MRNLFWLVILLLSGCMTRAARMDEDMRGWAGADIHDVVSQLGRPTDVYSNGPNTIWEWRATGPTRFSMNRWRSGADAALWQDSCRVWFDVAPDEHVLRGHWEGRCG